MLTAMERDQFNEKRSNRLREYILDDQELLGELTASADIEVIKDLTRALQLSTVFDDMDKRSLLARLVKAHPAVQSLVTGEQTKQDSSLLVSWESLERRRVEYQELVQKKIPANSKEIAIARSYGDLRENHEYKAAKEMQKILMRQKGRTGNPAHPRPRHGFFQHQDRRRRHRQHRAGHRPRHEPAGDLHDSRRVGFRPGKGHHQLPFARRRGAVQPQAGDEVEFEFHGAKHRHRIEKIEAWKAPAVANPQRLCQLKHRFPPCPPCNLRNWHLRFKRHRRFDEAALGGRAALFKSPKKKFGGLPTAATTASFFAGD